MWYWCLWLCLNIHRAVCLDWLVYHTDARANDREKYVYVRFLYMYIYRKRKGETKSRKHIVNRSKSKSTWFKSLNLSKLVCKSQTPAHPPSLPSFLCSLHASRLQFFFFPFLFTIRTILPLGLATKLGFPWLVLVLKKKNWGKNKKSWILAKKNIYWRVSIGFVIEFTQRGIN